MPATSSDFGRLSRAWNPAQPPAAPAPAPAPAPAAEPHASQYDASAGLQLDARLVLVVTRSALSIDTDHIHEATPNARAYRLETALPLDAADLQFLIEQRQPRFLLMDAELCAEFGNAAVRHLRRIRPDTDWILSWPEKAPRWVETIVCSQARGAIARGASARELAHALGAILDGELWFSRTMTTWLYSRLLGAARATPSGAGAPHDALAGAELTEREAEVLALMKQGLSNKQIGERLDISINTVKKHLAHAFEKRGLHRRRQVLG